MIDNNINKNVSLSEACKLLGISRNGYTTWKYKNSEMDTDTKLRARIHEIVEEFPYYGYKRVTKALQRNELKVNHKRVYRIMREEKLLCKRKKFKPVTTQSCHNFRKYDNLTKGFVPKAINQLVVADITYIALQQEFVYLTVIMDVYSRRFIGWDLNRKADSQMTLNALNTAIALRGIENLRGCIHHSDQGVQYASDDYIRRLYEAHMLPSMSSKGNSYDNAYAESAIKTIKYNEVYMKEYESFEEAYSNIKKFIEEVYNKKRLHSGIGYIPPEEYEKKQKN